MSEQEETGAAVAVPSATIHDLGYQRYLGSRRPQNTRYRTIVKNLVGSAWRGWWTMKAWVVASVLAAVVIGAIMWVEKSSAFKQLQALSGKSLTYADALLPLSLVYLTKIGFILSLTVACRVVCNDLRAGAFEFYFSRPVRPFDYVLGKSVGVIMVVGTALFVAPVLLSIYRVFLVDEVSQIKDHLIVIPKMMLVAGCATLAYSVIPLAFSAISNRARHTIAIFAVVHVIGGSIMEVIAVHAGAPELAAFDISNAVYGVAYGVFDVTLLRESAGPPFGMSVAVLGAYLAASLGFLYWRVVAAQRAGLGGG